MSEIHASLQRAAMNGRAVDLTIQRSGAGGVSNALRSVFVLEVGARQVRLRLADGTEASLALEEVIAFGVREKQQRSLLGAIADLLSLTR